MNSVTKSHSAVSSHTARILRGAGAFLVSLVAYRMISGAAGALSETGGPWGSLVLAAVLIVVALIGVAPLVFRRGLTPRRCDDEAAPEVRAAFELVHALDSCSLLAAMDDDARVGDFEAWPAAHESYERLRRLEQRARRSGTVDAVIDAQIAEAFAAVRLQADRAAGR